MIKKRTWKDAACDLAWNCFKRDFYMTRQRPQPFRYHDERVFVDLSRIIKKYRLFVVYEFIKFPEFKKAFLNWLENEKEWWEKNERKTK